ncbi:MAG: hypothetical protein ACRCV9_09185, partial [Burkholderiaceae bacterium]
NVGHLFVSYSSSMRVTYDRSNVICAGVREGDCVDASPYSVENIQKIVRKLNRDRHLVVQIFIFINQWFNDLFGKMMADA